MYLQSVLWFVADYTLLHTFGFGYFDSMQDFLFFRCSELLERLEGRESL